MGRSLILAGSVACYAAFFGAFVYLVGFVAAFDPLPTHVDKGLPLQQAPPCLSISP